MDPSLYRAARSGDINFLNIEDACIDPLHQRTPKENNLLHIAAEFKQIDFFKHVKLNYESPRFWVTNKSGDTPLHVAARVGCHAVVEFVIDHTKSFPLEGADDQESVPADAETYKQLLRMPNFQNDTALHIAVRYGHDKVATLLIKADPELCYYTNSANESPLFLAIRKSSPSIASYILEESPSHASPYLQGTNGLTALHAAVTHQDLASKGIVKTMVSTNPEIIREPEALGWTPLHYAALIGNLEATRVLLQSNSSVSYIMDNSGSSPLHIAAYAGHTNVMEELIRCRPDTCDLVNENGQSALHAAVIGSRINVVKYILKTPGLSGLTNEADKDGDTPLHLAAICRNQDIIRILAQDSRVDILSFNKESTTALDIFLGNNIGEQEILGNSRTILHHLKCSVGVPFLQQQISHNLKKLTTRERDTSDTLAIIGIKREQPQANLDQALKRYDNKLLVATLIATVTFAAGFTNVPGGFKNDGSPVLYEHMSFSFFQFWNMVSFILSVLAILNESTPLTVLSTRLPTPASLIQFSIGGMVIAFLAGTATLQPKHPRGSPADKLFSVMVLTFLVLAVILVSVFVVQLYRVRRMRVLLNGVI
ncbi:ankyrin repeat-containing protein ITN1 [Rosa chinensis]|nr:ankyrin repeat-containing protein ITN1 [Rosa chinensis]